jgi:hypothetical protein
MLTPAGSAAIKLITPDRVDDRMFEIDERCSPVGDVDAL